MGRMKSLCEGEGGEASGALLNITVPARGLAATLNNSLALFLNRGGTRCRASTAVLVARWTDLVC